MFLLVMRVCVSLRSFWSEFCSVFLSFTFGKGGNKVALHCREREGRIYEMNKC